MRVRSLPQANCDGDKGTSLVESDWYVSGREFTMLSASFTTVLNSSSVRNFLDIAVARLAFIVLTNLSKWPPIQGDLGVWCFHRTFLLWRYSRTEGSSCRSSRKVSPAMNVLWLSESINVGMPLVAANLRRQIINEDVVRFSTTSRCTALVVAHTNRQIYAFCLSALRVFDDITPRMVHSNMAEWRNPLDSLGWEGRRQWLWQRPSLHSLA